MSQVKSQKVKAILYTLPFPITIALIGSHSIANSLTLSGLMLTTGFLWGCYYLHIKLGANILYVDILLSILYVILAYILAHSLHISFWYIFAVYICGWIILMILFRQFTFIYSTRTVAPTNIWFKATIIFVVAYLLFSAHHYLAAFVVTFPYNGVFAVFENRAGLQPQAALFTRNSVALAAYFVANYLVGNQLSAGYRYLFSWTAFGVALIIANFLVRIRVRSV